MEVGGGCRTAGRPLSLGFLFWMTVVFLRVGLPSLEPPTHLACPSVSLTLLRHSLQLACRLIRLSVVAKEITPFPFDS